MDKQSRRDAVRAFKERKVRAGVFAVRCQPTGEAWVSSSRNLDGQQASLWFQLKMKGCYTRTLQAAWNAHGEGAFNFEVLQIVEDEDLTPAGLVDELKRQEVQWRETLGAQKALG
jgi:hypothetical protein